MADDCISIIVLLPNYLLDRKILSNVMLIIEAVNLPPGNVKIIQLFLIIPQFQSVNLLIMSDHHFPKV